MEKSQESLRLRIYEIYAWGMPTIITIVAAVLDNLPETGNDRFLRPHFGENKCWFNGKFLITIFRCMNISNKELWMYFKKACLHAETTKKKSCVES